MITRQHIYPDGNILSHSLEIFFVKKKGKERKLNVNLIKSPRSNQQFIRNTENKGTWRTKQRGRMNKIWAVTPKEKMVQFVYHQQQQHKNCKEIKETEGEPIN